MDSEFCYYRVILSTESTSVEKLKFNKTHIIEYVTDFHGIVPNIMSVRRIYALVNKWNKASNKYKYWV